MSAEEVVLARHGFLFAEFTTPPVTAIAQAVFEIGKCGLNAGCESRIDEVKRTRSPFDVEEICDHARGALVEFAVEPRSLIFIKNSKEPPIVRQKSTLGLSLLALLTLLALGQAGATDHEDQAAIRELIEKTYVNGAFNGLDPDAMRRGFHPDFAIFSPDGENISKYPIATWADGVAKRKASEDFDPEKNKWSHNFASLDVTGQAAAVKIELSHEGELVYTDYLSLLRFDSGWRIAGKVYHDHRN